MILVMLLVFTVMFAVGMHFLDRLDGCEGINVALAFVGGVGAVITLVATVILTCEVVSNTTIDDRIAMYQEENTKIESQIAEVVNQYQKYETDIFESVSKENAITYVTLYPELKSDSLVQAQIETYVANNEKIKELKDSAIRAPVTRWWLYFGK